MTIASEGTKLRKMMKTVIAIWCNRNPNAVSDIAVGRCDRKTKERAHRGFGGVHSVVGLG